MIGCPEGGYLATLSVEITPQFPGYVNDAQSALIVADIEFVVIAPQVMGTGLGHFVSPNLDGMIHVDHVYDVPGSNPLPMAFGTRRWPAQALYGRAVL